MVYGHKVRYHVPARSTLLELVSRPDGRCAVRRGLASGAADPGGRDPRAGGAGEARDLVAARRDGRGARVRPRAARAARRAERAASRRTPRSSSRTAAARLTSPTARSSSSAARRAGGAWSRSRPATRSSARAGQPLPRHGARAPPRRGADDLEPDHRRRRQTARWTSISASCGASRLYHLSWWRILTEAIVQHRHRGVCRP